MSKKFKVPKLGENVETATVAKVLVSEGDTIEKEQAVMELESEKAAADVPCDVAGTVEKIHVQEGDEVKVGQTLLTLDTGAGEDEARDQESQEDDKSGGQQETEPEAPQEDKAKDQETDGKEAPQDRETEEGDTSRDNKPQDQEAKGKEKEQPPGVKDRGGRGETPQDRAEPPPSSEAKTETVSATSSVRRFAREVGVDVAEVQGRGRGGRISVEDVKAHARSRDTSETGSRGMELDDFSQWGHIERKPMTNVRRVTADRMSMSVSAIPQAVQFGRADITRLEEYRRQYTQEAHEAGGHLSLTVILVKTLAGALKVFPRFNASMDAGRDEIIYKKYCHIGVAVATDRGLIVPVLRDVGDKSVLTLAAELNDLVERARQGKLSLKELKGGCMTLTNAGALGGDLFIPIVNWPEAAILGTAHSRLEATYRNKCFEPRCVLPLSLSYDHRIVDGADAALFMNWYVKALEDPVRLAWGGRALERDAGS